MQIKRQEPFALLKKQPGDSQVNLSRRMNYLYLAFALAKRDILARYRRSTIGFFWAILDPLFHLLIFSVIRQFLGITTGDMPYTIFLISGLVPWNLFIHVVNNITPSILSNAGVMKKTRVPREVFPLVTVFTGLFDHLMALMIVLVMMIIYRAPFTLHLLWLPVLIGLMVAFASGLGMGVASFGIFRRDIIRAGSYIFQLLFYLSPIFYPIEMVPVSLRKYYLLNPLVGILNGFRNVLGSGAAPDLLQLAYALPVVLLVLLIGWRIYRYRSVYFTDYL